MSWVHDVLADYGRSLGIDGLAFNEAGVVSLRFELLGEVFIEQTEGGVLVYVVREVDRLSGEICAAALAWCHWQHNHPFAVNAAQRGEHHLVYSVHLTEQEFSVPTMEQLLQLLGQLHDQALEGAPA